MSEALGLGKIITTEQHRDAIHIAVMPVLAGEQLSPGDRVVMRGDFAFRVGKHETYVGIVDPFIGKDQWSGNVNARERFWLWLIPGSITSLRHVWTHPVFPEGLEPAEPVTKTSDQHKADSEKWLRAEAERLDIGYRSLLDAAALWVEDAEYTVQRDSQRWRDDFGDPKEFWHHYEIVTGTKVEDHTATFFCCSC